MRSAPSCTVLGFLSHCLGVANAKTNVAALVAPSQGRRCLQSFLLVDILFPQRPFLVRGLQWAAALQSMLCFSCRICCLGWESVMSFQFCVVSLGCSILVPHPVKHCCVRAVCCAEGMVCECMEGPKTPNQICSNLGFLGIYHLESKEGSFLKDLFQIRFVTIFQVPVL